MPPPCATLLPFAAAPGSADIGAASRFSSLAIAAGALCGAAGDTASAAIAAATEGAAFGACDFGVTAVGVIVCNVSRRLRC